jgi:hypothetical protein
VITNEDRQLAGQAWCDPETSRIEMDVRLAEAFARRIAPLRAEVERLTKDRDEWKAASEAWSERAHAGWQKRAEAAEKALEAGKVMTPAMLDSVSEGDLRILYAWSSGRQGEVERAKTARNAAEARLAVAEQVAGEAEALLETLAETLDYESISVDGLSTALAEWRKP